MCLGYEGVLSAVSGEGVTRHGLLDVEGRRLEIGLCFVPEARPGDRILAHSGQGVRIIPNSSTKLMDRA